MADNEQVNPVDTAQLLVEQLGRCLEEKELADARRSELEGLAEWARDLKAQLVDFERGVVPLDLDDGSTGAIANRIWSELQPGIIRLGDDAMQRLVSASRVLGALHRNGFDIQSVQKFSRDEIAYARFVGHHVAVLTDPWLRLRKQGKGNLTVKFRAGASGTIQQLVRQLERLGVVSSCQIRQRNFRKDNAEGWIPVDPSRAKRLREHNPKMPMRAALERTETWSRSLSFVEGLWLNAYAYDVIDDHLGRRELDYEIYTNVQYQAPGDIIKSAGDFDVLVASGDRFAVVECKVGRVDVDRGDLEQVIEHTRGLRLVFNRLSANIDLHSLLLVNPELNDVQELGDVLADTGIDVLAPDTVRVTFQDLFRSPDVRGQEADSPAWRPPLTAV